MSKILHLRFFKQLLLASSCFCFFLFRLPAWGQNNFANQTDFGDGLISKRLLFWMRAHAVASRGDSGF